MGIYNSCDIFGIRMYNFDENYNENIFFEKRYHEIMTVEQMREAYLFYNTLKDKKMSVLKFSVLVLAL